MIQAFSAKKGISLAPAAALNNAAAAPTAIDTYNFDYLEVDVLVGAMGAAATVLKMQESDGLSGSNLDGNAADVVGTRYGTDNNDTGSASTLPAANTNNVIYSFFMDLRGGRKRYQQPALTVGVGNCYPAISYRLSRAESGPRTAADGNYSQRMIV